MFIWNWKILNPVAVSSNGVSAYDVWRYCEILLRISKNKKSWNYKIKAKSDGCTKVVSSSGGNAGLAVARSARVLGLKSTVVVPLTTNQHAINLLIEQNAEVIRHGSVWNEAHEFALTLVGDQDSSSCYIHAFDDPVVWYVTHTYKSVI